MTHAIILLGSFGCGFLGALAVARFGPRLRLLDHPGARSSHDRPIPKGGGAGILIAFVGVGWASGLPVSFLGPAVMLAVFSFVNDRREVPAPLRLGIQVLAAAWLLVGTSHAADPGGLTAARLIVLGIYIVGVTNCFNFMDGINGISGVTAVLAFGLIWLTGAAAGCLSMYQPVCLALAGASLGFLPLNFPRARVFMGDGGSILLGFAFAGLVAAGSATLTDFLIMNSFLWLYLLDACLTIAVRLRDGENLLQAHRRHIYQLLANQGNLPHWKVTLLYGGFQLAIGTAGLLARDDLVWLTAALVAASVVFFLFSVRIRRRFEGRPASK